ncbi:MAG: cation-translocating P-type ATPase [Planctomycetes bacterium]|nr:cation-translocating P-type ATPase [Planctomycetota bacterium]
MNHESTPGQTTAEVAERTLKGLVNRTRRSAWADYLPIVSRHVFTLFNFIVIPAAVALFYQGEWQAGISVTGTALINTIIGLFQDWRAKRQLDHLAILTATKARVIRDGQSCEIPAGDVVEGDTIMLMAGDTVIADGTVLDAKFLELDEALLTGESDPVRREKGATLLSGSMCVTGEGTYRADKVGDQAFAQNISSAARRYSYSSSPMTHVINWIISILSVTALVLCALYFTLYYLKLVSGDQLVLMIAATITSMIPQGLVLTATVSFTIGAVVISRRGALVQRLNAVEAMASVDVICTDKTGTLTTNRLRLDQIKILAADVPEAEVQRRLSLFATASIDQKNKNIQAICAAYGRHEATVLDQIPFKSQNRYSAVKLRDEKEERVFVLGAPEALIKGSVDWNDDLVKLQKTGLRVLLFAEVPSESVAATSFANATLPQNLRFVALVALADELRPDAASVLKALSAQGIAFKVISGDNPETVRATIAHLELPLSREPIVSGKDLAATKDLAAFVADHSVFGRVEPLQKVQIVEALQKAGWHVAMIGDGVNDVLPIKKANLGIAMGEGSQAAKTVSSLVLEKNDFAMLPETIEEGRTIVRNLRRGAKLFLVKNVYSLIIILLYATGVFGLPFPYLPQQVSLLNWLVIGVPAFLIALTRERSLVATRTSFLRDVGWFAVRTGIVFAVAGIAILALSKHVWLNDEKTQRTMLLSMLVLLGITNLHRALTDGNEQPIAADKFLFHLSFLVIPAYLIAMYWPFSAGFFRLTMLSVVQWLEVLLVAVPAYGLSVLSDRIRLDNKPARISGNPPIRG